MIQTTKDLSLSRSLSEFKEERWRKLCKRSVLVRAPASLSPQLSSKWHSRKPATKDKVHYNIKQKTSLKQEVLEKNLDQVGEKTSRVVYRS